jgi:hypothetical protein
MPSTVEPCVAGVGDSNHRPVVMTFTTASR